MRMARWLGLMLVVCCTALAGAQESKLPALPALKPLLDTPVRDTCVEVGPDGMYYLIGTTGHPTWWQTNEGIRLWKSKDLKEWEPVGLVWSFEKNLTWQKGRTEANGKLIRAIWAPEIHYIKKNFYIPYCINTGGTGVLRSTTGKAEGPYEDIKKDGPLTGEIDASMFEDDDGSVYFVFQNGKIAKFKEDMSGLAEKPHLLKPEKAKDTGFEGAFLFKANKRYYLSCAEFNKRGPKGEAMYDCMISTADTLAGPWSEPYIAIPHGGHNMFFQDKDGQWWSTFFGNDSGAPFRERAGILRVEFDESGRVRPKP